MQAASLIIGVIGHVDHGKTALVRALTGMETDRLAEERRRGISIALGFAHLTIDGSVIDLIDMPGHERFIRTMISGATGIRAVLLVVAANEGIKPQTIEHAEVAALLGVRNAIVVVTKTDIVDRTTAEAASARAGELAAGLELRGPPPVMVSAPSGRGIAALRQAIGAMAGGMAPGADRGACYLPIDRAFSIAGHGTVVTGTLRGGPIAAGDELEFGRDQRRVRVRGVQVRNGSVAVAAPGQRIGVNLRAIEPEAAQRGLSLAAPGLLVASSWLTVELRAAPSAPPLASAAALRLLYGASETGAAVRLLDRATLMPGESCFAQVRCAPRIAVPVGEGVILRASSPPRVIAGGRVLDATAQRLRRNDGDALAWAATLARGTVEAILLAALARARGRGTPIIDLARLTAQSLGRTEAALRRSSALIVGGLAVEAAAFETLRDDVVRVLGRSWPDRPDGLSREQLRTALPDCGAAVLDHLLVSLSASGVIERTGRIRLLRADREQARRSAEDGLASRLAEAFRAAGLSPPTGSAPDTATKRALDRLVREGVLVRATDHVQKREILFHREAIEEARRRLRPLLADGAGVLVGDAGAALGISRKYSVPLLEYLDSIQFTRRMGDRRRLREP